MIKKIVFVTGNATKLLHAREALKGLNIEIINQKIDLIEPREDNPDQVAAQKAIQAFNQINQPLIVEDSGIFITALNGFPKTFIHFAQDTIGLSGIMKLMAGVTDRSAEFRQSLAYFDAKLESPMIFNYVDGGYQVADKIWEPKHESTEFDRILIPSGENQPLCMFDPEWRAKRDNESNRETIHYRQLARWLAKRQA